MGCCGLIQSEIEKQYLKGKFDKTDNIICKDITYLLYACSTPFHTLKLYCGLYSSCSHIIMSESLIIEETMGCPSPELT